MVKIISERQVALDSPDFLVQQEKNLKSKFSAAEDNSTNKTFIEEICKFIADSRSSNLYDLKLNVLDLGCGGGQLIADFSQEIFIDKCIGLDGIAGTLNRPNWTKYKNNLLNVDLSKDFSIVDEKGELIKFDLITSWEMIEHLHEKDLDTFFVNMHKHLKDDGIFVGSIALFPDVRDEYGFYEGHPSHDPSTKQFILHQSVFPEDVWKNKILKNYNVLEYPLKSNDYKCGYLAVRDHPKDENGNGGSYYLMIKK